MTEKIFAILGILFIAVCIGLSIYIIYIWGAKPISEVPLGAFFFIMYLAARN